MLIQLCRCSVSTGAPKSLLFRIRSCVSGDPPVKGVGHPSLQEVHISKEPSKGAFRQAYR